MIWVHVDAKLDFYRTASTVLKALEILIALVDVLDARLVVTAQTLGEFLRRREAAVAAGREALKAR